MKIMKTIIPTDLGTNLLLYFLCPLQAKNKNQVLASCLSGSDKYFCLFRTSPALLQSHVKFKGLL